MGHIYFFICVSNSQGNICRVLHKVCLSDIGKHKIYGASHGKKTLLYFLLQEQRFSQICIYLFLGAELLYNSLCNSVTPRLQDSKTPRLRRFQLLGIITQPFFIYIALICLLNHDMNFENHIKTGISFNINILCVVMPSPQCTLKKLIHVILLKQVLKYYVFLAAKMKITLF